ncbi:DUF1403 family protein [Methylocystis sp. IM3]|uniref:DUF1403 family protein n=1 Tax=unclassified Methylocystis TaxID=2625913 RepID=UPI0030F5BF1F
MRAAGLLGLPEAIDAGALAVAVAAVPDPLMAAARANAAAMKLCPQAAELARRSQKLLSVAPMLRAKGARRVVDMLLADDGVTPAAAAARAGLSDRAARRLFDRLVMLGAVRELTGRDTFRIYGL